MTFTVKPTQGQPVTVQTADQAVDEHQAMDAQGWGPITIETSLPESMELAKAYQRKVLDA